LTNLEDAPTGFSNTTDVNYRRVFCEQDIRAFDMILDTLLNNIDVMCFVKVLFACLLVIPDESQVFTIEIQSLRVVIIDLT